MRIPPSTHIRPITTGEACLIKYLMEKIPDKTIEFHVPVEVSDMDDGGMGSLRLNHNEGRRFGKDLIQAQYFDRDGTLVLVTLVEDHTHELLELDMWKVDFSPLIFFPVPDLLIFEVSQSLE